MSDPTNPSLRARNRAASRSCAFIPTTSFIACSVSIRKVPIPALSSRITAIDASSRLRYRKRLEASIAVMRDESAGIGTFLIDTLQAMKLVVGMNAQDREAARFRARNDGFVGSLMAMRRLTYFAGG